MARPLRRPPAFLFRYRPPNDIGAGYLEDLLRTNRLYATPPRKFSDWFDCRANIDAKGTRSEYLRYWNHNGELLRLKGKARARFAASMVASGGWNDPAKHQQVLDLTQAALDNSGVICLTETPLLARMWDEYAGGGQGICLCFESLEPPLKTFLDVQYVPVHPQVRFNASSEELVEAFLLAKTNSYAWEREWRQVYYNEGGGPRPISPESLRAVLIGYLTSVADRSEVLRLVAQFKPSVAVLEVKQSGAGLNLVRVHHAGPGPGLMPPIQEWVEPELEGKDDVARIRDHLTSVPAGHRRPEIEKRLETLLIVMDGMKLAGRKPDPENPIVKVMPVALLEARKLVLDLVDPEGAALPGYGGVAVLLYRMVRTVGLRMPALAPYLFA